MLFPDRTTGGVSVKEGNVILDLTHGIRIRKTRRAAGDFRTGALFHAHLPLNDQLRSFVRNPGNESSLTVTRRRPGTAGQAR